MNAGLIREGGNLPGKRKVKRAPLITRGPGDQCREIGNTTVSLQPLPGTDSSDIFPLCISALVLIFCNPTPSVCLEVSKPTPSSLITSSSESSVCSREMYTFFAREYLMVLFSCSCMIR